jgi:phospholipid/cholesterol/gamma-HCH transport system permease protein
MFTWIGAIGRVIIDFISEMGQTLLLFATTLVWLVRPPFRLKITFKQMERVGIDSLPVILITATFTGLVLALQSYTGFKRFNAESMVGTVVALSMTRELGPVLTGLIVAGRVGSSMAAELGTMKVTEQIDALYTLATDPVKYLIVPRFLAGMIMLPLLAIICDITGIMGGFLISVNLLGANPTVYLRRTWLYLELNDIYTGLFKACVFGMIIAMIGCYQGFYTSGGAEGVGKATTKAVVVSSMLILVFDYILTAFFF